VGGGYDPLEEAYKIILLICRYNMRPLSLLQVARGMLAALGVSVRGLGARSCPPEEEIERLGELVAERRRGGEKGE